MNLVIKRIQRDYSLAFKLPLVDQIEKGEMTWLPAIQHQSASLVQQCARERQREVHAQILVDSVRRERALATAVITAIRIGGRCSATTMIG